MSEEEEFEFRARAEAEEAQARQAAQPSQATAQVPGQGPVAPGMLDQAGNFVTQTALPVAFGVGKAGFDLAAAHPAIAAGAASMLPNSVLSKIPGGQKLVAGKEFFSNLGNAAQAYAQKESRLQNRPGFGGPAGSPTNPIGATGPVAPQGAPQPAQQSMANKIRQIAAQRIAGFGASGAAVPAGVALGGAAATGIAGGQLAAMTPEQRKAYYDSMMMGAMSGDAGLAAAIMNQGQ